MKWKKLGKIFNPVDHSLINNCVEFAQSPQVLVFDEFVRIYFSTRERDKTGKYLSHIAFVDMDKEFKKVINLSTKPVIQLGDLGCFDEHGIFPINVVKNQGRVMAYTTGWNRKVSISADASIGLAFSDNGGISFEKFGKGPILTSSLHEPFLVGDAFVKVYNEEYHMWYIFGTEWITDPSEDAPQRVYKIAHATSNNGVTWVKEGKKIISDKLNSHECQALPTVIDFDNKYHMFFCYRAAIGFRKIKDKAYRIGYAHSDDLKNWIREDSLAGIDISTEGWDSDMMCYPHVFKCDNNIYLLYNGNEFGKFGFGLAILEEF